MAGGAEEPLRRRDAAGKQGLNRPVLVTGATGRIGEMLRQRLTRGAVAGADIRLQTRHATDRAAGHGSWVTWSLGDGGTAAALDGVHTVLHLAGITPTAGTDHDEADFTRINADMTLDLLDRAARQGVRRVLVASSAAVYGAPPGDAPLRETDPLAPANPYGRSKAAMERAVGDWADRHGEVETCCLRIANVAGADQLVAAALKATADDPMMLDRFEGSGHAPLRSYVGPDDLAGMLLALALHPGPLPRCLNVAAPGAVRLDDLLDALGAGRGAPVPWQPRPAPAHAIERVVLDTARLADLVPSSVMHSTPCPALAMQALDYLRQRPANDRDPRP